MKWLYKTVEREFSPSQAVNPTKPSQVACWLVRRPVKPASSSQSLPTPGFFLPNTFGLTKEQWQKNEKLKNYPSYNYKYVNICWRLCELNEQRHYYCNSIIGLLQCQCTKINYGMAAIQMEELTSIYYNRLLLRVNDGETGWCWW